MAHHFLPSMIGWSLPGLPTPIFIYGRFKFGPSGSGYAEYIHFTSRQSTAYFPHSFQVGKYSTDMNVFHI